MSVWKLCMQEDADLYVKNLCIYQYVILFVLEWQYIAWNNLPQQIRLTINESTFKKSFI